MQIYNESAEFAVVSACFHSNRLADEIVGLVAPEAIGDAAARLIYLAVVALRAHKMPIDPVTVYQHLRSAGATVSRENIAEWRQRGVETYREAALYHARTVNNCARINGIAEAARRILSDVNGYSLTGGYVQADELAERALAEINRVMAHDVRGGQLISIGESVVGVWDQIQGGIQPGISTGYRDLDSLTGGWHAGDLNLIAARPGCGKTAFALNAAERVANNGTPVFFSSMEMAHDQLSGRLLAKRSGIDGQAIRLRSVAHVDMPTIARAVEGMLELPITVYDKAAITLSDLRARVSVWRDQHPGQAVIFVDYLQLMRGEERRKDSRHLEVGEISQGLKALAREMDAPLIALSQLSRAIEGRAGHVPMLSDLRESGSLEQDADMVMFIHREELYDAQTDRKGVADLIISKQRNGPLGAVPLRFDSATTMFSDLTYRTPEGY